MDFHPYGYKTSPRFYSGQASAAFPRVSQFSKIPIFSIRTNDLNELPHRAVDIVQLHFLTKIKNMCKKYY